MFEVKGTKPEWALAYDLLASRETGSVITYDELDDALGRDFRSNRGPVYRAVRELEKQQQKTARVIDGVGYEIVDGGKQVGVAKGRGDRARRQLRKGRHTLDTTDRNLLTQEEADKADRIGRRMAAAEESIRRLEAKQKRTEVKVDDVEARVSDLETTHKHERDDQDARIKRIQEQLDELKRNKDREDGVAESD